MNLSEAAQADTWFDLAAIFIVAVPGILTALGGLFVVVRKASKQHEAADRVAAERAETAAAERAETARMVEQASGMLREVRESTVNSHPRPMRYDLDDKADKQDVERVETKLDAFIGEVQSLLTRLEERTGRIGDEVRTNNDLRKEEDARQREALARLSEAVAQRPR